MPFAQACRPIALQMRLPRLHKRHSTVRLQATAIPHEGLVEAQKLGIKLGRRSKYSRSFDFCSNHDIQGRDAGSPTTGPPYREPSAHHFGCSRFSGGVGGRCRAGLLFGVGCRFSPDISAGVANRAGLLASGHARSAIILPEGIGSVHVEPG